jgi:hypothetical protein
MSNMGEGMHAQPHHRSVDVGVVIMAGAAVAAIYWADRRYRKWAKETSVLAAPKARAAAIGSSYRRKRSGMEEIAGLIGDIFEAVEQARKRAANA